MENRINQVMELADGNSYVVLKQAVYKGENYYVAAKLTEDKNDVLEDFTVFKLVVNDGQDCMLPIDDPSLIKLVCKYVGLLDE